MSKITIDHYRDGGTLSVSEESVVRDEQGMQMTLYKEYFVNNMIGAKDRYAVYPCYPSKGEAISLEKDLINAKQVLHKAVPYYRAPVHLHLIAEGLTWIDNQLRELGLKESEIDNIIEG